MNPERHARAPFNAATKVTAREVSIRMRTEHAVERLSARHEANEARLVAQRFQKLSRSDRPQPALRPGWASEDRQAWLMRAAKYQVAREHGMRLQKVRNVAERMIAKGGNSRTKGNRDMGR